MLKGNFFYTEGQFKQYTKLPSEFFGVICIISLQKYWSQDLQVKFLMQGQVGPCSIITDCGRRHRFSLLYCIVLRLYWDCIILDSIEIVLYLSHTFSLKLSFSRRRTEPTVVSDTWHQSWLVLIRQREIRKESLLEFLTDYVDLICLGW